MPFTDLILFLSHHMGEGHETCHVLYRLGSATWCTFINGQKGITNFTCFDDIFLIPFICGSRAYIWTRAFQHHHSSLNDFLTCVIDFHPSLTYECVAHWLNYTSESWCVVAMSWAPIWSLGWDFKSRSCFHMTCVGRTVTLPSSHKALCGLLTILFYAPTIKD